MSVEGLRAWIGEVERKLRMRTRVFLVLAVIAIGLGGAAIYLAIDTRESAVSESDVRALQQELETRIGEAAASTPTAPPVEAESAPQPEEPAPGQEGKEKGSGTGGATVTPGGTGAGAGASQGVPKGATGGSPSAAQLQKRVEEAAKANAEAETEHGGK